MSKKNNIAAVVVTFNRLNLLKKCIDGIRNQSYKYFDVIIVNNGSSDGTEEWLNSQKGIFLINQENKGGAGGFYTGMKAAYNAGYEWVWLMDDDGVPGKSQLQMLVEGCHKHNVKFANALVCNKDKPEELAFELYDEGKLIKNVSEATMKETIDSINPFNGTIIHRDVIQKIGFVKREMFIWGDETEYNQRARINGFKRVTITSAIHNHPANKKKTQTIIPFINKGHISIAPPKISHVFYRNIGFIYHFYFKQREYKIFLYYFASFALRLNCIELFKFVKYFNQGRHNIFN